MYSDKTRAIIVIYTCIVSTAVTDLTLTGVDENTLNVSWGPPVMPNGYVAMYTVIIVNNVTTSQSNELSSDFIYIAIQGLCKLYCSSQLLA